MRAGHPWVFSNEIEAVEGAPPDGSIVDVVDSRGAYLGRGYLHSKSLIAVRILTRGREAIDVEFFRKRLRRAIAYRGEILPDERVLRLVASEGDFLPGLVVDRYGDVLAIQITTLGIEQRRDLVREVLLELLEPRAIVLRGDVPIRKLEGLPLESLVWHGELPESLVVELEGLAVTVDPLHGQKTGLFLDQRMNRRLLGGKVEVASVLDLFAYSGAWGLEALRRGAAESRFVDSSREALEAAKENAERNGLAARCRFDQGDVFEVLPAMQAERERFGAVILDPPALVKNRSRKAEGLRAYRELNRRAMALVGEGGWLFTCSCSHLVAPEEFLQILVEAARGARRPFRFLQWGVQSPDHPVLLAAPETAYLKCVVLRAL